MNYELHYELSHPNFAVIRTYDNGDSEGHKVVVIDANQAKYQGLKWPKLNRFQRRKFENLLVLTEPTNRIRVFYETARGLFYDREAAAQAI